MKRSPEPIPAAFRVLGFKGTKKGVTSRGKLRPRKDMKVPTTLSGRRFKGGRPREDPREPDSLFFPICNAIAILEPNTYSVWEVG